MDWSELIGILFGDGCICTYNYEVRITLGSIDYQYAIIISEYLLENGLHPIIKMYDNEVWIRIWNKKFWKLLLRWFKPGRKKLLRIPAKMTSFIRGVFDTDGSIHLDKGRHPVISIRNKELNILEQIKSYLAEKHIKAHIYGPEKTEYNSIVWKLRVYGIKNTQKWLKLIGSSNPRKYSILLYALRPGETVRGESRGSEPD